jgi:hypothetical protein
MCLTDSPSLQKMQVLSSICFLLARLSVVKTLLFVGNHKHIGGGGGGAEILNITWVINYDIVIGHSRYLRSMFFF